MCSLLLLSASCKKEKSKNPIDDLPPATQTGANTFGCLVNGKAFLPKGSGFGGPVLECRLDYINYGFRFFLNAIDTKNTPLRAVTILTDSLELSEGTYVLNKPNINGSVSGEFVIIDNTNINAFETSPQFNGILNITKYDKVKFIISGTFSFDAVNKSGEKVEIKEGRFDMKF
jgi:hypothetical protein